MHPMIAVLCFPLSHSEQCWPCLIVRSDTFTFNFQLLLILLHINICMYRVLYYSVSCLFWRGFIASVCVVSQDRGVRATPGGGRKTGKVLRSQSHTCFSLQCQQVHPPPSTIVGAWGWSE